MTPGVGTSPYAVCCEEDQIGQTSTSDRASGVIRRLPISTPEQRRAALVEGLRRGDSNAAVELFDLYAPRINRRVWRLLGADPEHDDVVQQVFAQLFSSVGKLRAPEALVSWIDMVTVNTVRKELRRRSRRPFYPVSADLPEPAAAPGQETAYVFQRALEVLKKMKSDDRIVFVLRFVEQAELAEIAVACGMSLATVKRRIARSRGTFMKKVARDPVLTEYAKGLQFGR
jgi:RNA polymerase sigma-70 factor (ECF subfamily)